MIIRHWNQHDLPAVGVALRDLRQYTFQFHSGEYDASLEEVIKWLVGVYADTRSTVIIGEEQGDIVAIIGVTYESMALPPFLVTLHEWCLWGTAPKPIAQVWKAAKQWGKTRGAVFAKRSILQQNRSHEHIKWEKLL
jgi:hypothetical protein